MTPETATKTGIAEVGEMRLWKAGQTPPKRWAVADGRALHRDRYPDLAEAFTLPDGTDAYGQPDSEGLLVPTLDHDYFRIPFKPEYKELEGRLCWIIYLGEQVDP